jgi:hypothetical protein
LGKRGIVVEQGFSHAETSTTSSTNCERKDKKKA